MDCTHTGTVPYLQHGTGGQVDREGVAGSGDPRCRHTMDNDDARTDRLRAANRRVLIIVGLIALLLYLSQYFFPIFQ